MYCGCGGALASGPPSTTHGLDVAVATPTADPAPAPAPAGGAPAATPAGAPAPPAPAAAAPAAVASERIEGASVGDCTDSVAVMVVGGCGGSCGCCGGFSEGRCDGGKVGGGGVDEGDDVEVRG